MSTITHDIVAKLWNLCNILKDDGVTYHQYVTELTYLLFLKMAKETGTEEQIPDGYRWDDLENKAAPDRLEHYKLSLIHLGTHGSTLVKEIFAFIKRVNEEMGLTVLVIEQNARRALEVADHGYIMEQGRIVLEGSAQELQDNPDVKEFYLGLGESGGRKSFRDVKHYKRRKRWL